MNERAKVVGEPDAPIEEAWLDEAGDRFAAYGLGEIASLTLEEMIAARKNR
jgi:hypothetical protein